MKRKIRIVIKFASLSVCITSAISWVLSRIANPDITTLRFMLDYWPNFVLMAVCAFIAGWFWREN